MNEEEKKILLLIKVVPTIIGILFFISTSYMIFRNTLLHREQAIDDIKQNYIKTKKNLVKHEVQSLIRSIKYKKELAESKLKENLQSRVDEAYAIISNIYIENKRKRKKEILKLIKDALRPIRFHNGRGYYFIYSMDSKNILLPISPDLEGKDFSNYQDIKGDFVVKNIAKLVKEKGSTFYTWYWRKPYNLAINYKKIGYNRYFKSLDIFVGTGEYIVDFEKDLQQKILKEIENIKYGRSGYFFVYTYDGIPLTHLKKSIIGQNFIDVQNEYNKFTLKESIQIIQNSGGFFNFTDKKISYIDCIDSWSWIMGASEYTDYMDKIIELKKDRLKEQLNNSILKLIILFLIAGVLLTVILTMITRKTEEIFLKYKNNIIEEAKRNKKQLLLAEHQNKLAALGEMLGNISHQWKQPLNAIGLSLSKIILLDENNKLTKGILKTSLIRMEKNIIHLSKTIDVFRDFFKPDIKQNEFKLKDLIKNTVDITQDSFTNNHITLSNSCKENIILQGDKQKLEQVMLNILNNAKDALSSNKIKNPKVFINAKLNDNHVIITIKDNALGISDDIKDKIFIPYFTTKFKSQGTGIGLYMSKMIVENNFNGTLSFENKNKGTIFIITIPLSQ
jgi:signal transduction histidine kinase